MTNNIKRKTLKKQTIIDAATKLFYKNGYKKTSIAQIAKEANSSQVTLYKYFPSKIILGRTVLIKMIDDGYAQYSDLLNDPDIDFAKKMTLMINSSTQSSQDFNADFLKFMVSEFKGKNGDNVVMDVYNRQKYGFWKKLLDQGRKEHVISNDISDEAFMIYLDMYVLYALNPNSSDNNAQMMHQHDNELVHLFFYGIMGR